MIKSEQKRLKIFKNIQKNLKIFKNRRQETEVRRQETEEHKFVAPDSGKYEIRSTRQKEFAKRKLKALFRDKGTKKE